MLYETLANDCQTENHSATLPSTWHSFRPIWFTKSLPQWRTFLSISGHRPIKIPKRRIVPTPIRTLVWLKQQVWWSRVPLFLWCCGEAFCRFPTEFKPLVSAKDRGVGKCIWTVRAPCLDWSILPRIVHGQSTLCFVGFVAGLKVDSWSEITLQRLFQDYCQ